MNTLFLAMLGWPEIVGIMVIVLVLFGARKVPELMRGLGHGIKEFKKATREVQDDIQQALEEEPPPPPRRTPAETSEHAQTVAHGSAQDKS
jgi:sec-independent protein translocase protein TatA